MRRFLAFFGRVLGALQGAGVGAFLGLLFWGSILALGLIGMLLLGWLFPSWDAEEGMGWVDSFATNAGIVLTVIGGLVGGAWGYAHGPEGIPLPRNADELKQWGGKWASTAWGAFLLVFVFPAGFFLMLMLRERKVGGYVPTNFDFGFTSPILWVVFLVACVAINAWRKSPEEVMVEDEDGGKFVKEEKGRISLCILALLLAFVFVSGGRRWEEAKARHFTYSSIALGPHCAYADADSEWEKRQCYNSGADLAVWYSQMSDEHKACLSRRGGDCLELHPACEEWKAAHFAETGIPADWVKCSGGRAQAEIGEDATEQEEQ